MTSVALPAGGRELRRRPVEPAVLDRGGADVGRGVDPEGHDLAEEPLRPPHDSRVVGVGHEHVVGARALEDLGLGVGDGVGGGEESEVRVADIGPHADVGLRDADQRANLSRVIHA